MSKYGLFLVFSLLVTIQCTSESDPVQFVELGDEPLSYKIITEQLIVPWQIATVPDGRIAVTEKRGVVRVIQNRELTDKPWLDLRDSLETSDGSPTVEKGGLLGIAVDPDFENNRYAYVGYSYEDENSSFDFNKLVRFKEDPQKNELVFDKVLLDSLHGERYHNSGQIKFGPDGKIYWSIGDRHVPEVSQDTSDLSGSILRLNKDGSIPADNPYPGSYVYAYGFRDTQGFDWHPDNKDIMLGTEHGPTCRDEVNSIVPGGNYGWPEIRGDEQKEGMITPLIHSGFNESGENCTWAPSGAAFVHSGPWRGTFLFGGLRSRSLWQLELDEEGSVRQLNRFLEDEFGRIRSVEQHPNGNLYIITSNLDKNQLPVGRDFLIELSVQSE